MKKTSSLNERIKKYAHSDAAALYRDLGTTKNGLRLDQVGAMKEKYGANTGVAGKAEAMSARLRRAFVNPFTVILFVLGLVALATDLWYSGSSPRNTGTVVIIAVMILISGTVRLTQELRSKRAYDRLDRLVHTHAAVKRDGVRLALPAEELVVGDHVFLAAGDRVPADIRLTHTEDLFVSQSAVTGESGILEKDSRVYSCQEEMAFSQYQNLVFMGTTVISGKGEGTVLAVGRETLYGSFKGPDALSPASFEKGAASIAWVLFRFMAVLVPIVFVAAGVTKGSWVEAFLFALSVAVGLTPEMLPMVITSCLAKGSVAMSKKQTIIRDINAMQGFGSMDILCMDKTGTLTNAGILLEYYMDILGNESEAVLRFAYLNSLYHSGVRNPIDAAILECRTMPGKGDACAALARQYQKVDEIPFDYNRKYASILLAGSAGHTLVMKGDVEAVFSRCAFVEYQGAVRPITRDGRASLDAVVAEMLEDGMKVVAVARKGLNSQSHVTTDDERDMILMGYLAFFDAPKRTAAQSIAGLRALQVQTKILTGDHRQIARSVCQRIGVDADSLLTGTELDALSDLELRRAAEKTAVFAELSPSQKVRIVEALQENGHTVGFLGDGMNDIPAICQADVGISVDTAVDAAKDMADVILLQKDLNVLEAGILEGRKTFTNMTKYIKITASSNFGNILSIVFASAFLPFLPMAAIQLLLLNLLYDTLCIVLPWDHVDSGACASPRDWSGKTLGRFMGFFGPISSLFDGITFLFLYFVLCPSLTGGLLYTQLTDPALQLQYMAVFQTGWFLESMWTQVLILHMLRTEKIPFLQSRPSAPVMLITVAGILLFTGLSFTPLFSVLGLTILPPRYFGFLLAVVAAYMLLTTVLKRLYTAKYGELI